jgi:hypothetical protein
VLAPDDQLPPQLAELHGRAKQAPEVEELAAAIGAVVVVDGHLDEAEASVVEFLDHLQGDSAAVGLELDALEDAAAEEAEVAVGIAQGQAEDEAHEMVIEPADDQPMEGVAAGDLVAVGDVGAAILRQGLGELAHLVRVILGVAVGVEDPLLGGVAEAGAQGGAVAAVAGVGDDAELRVNAAELGQHLGGVIL